MMINPMRNGFYRNCIFHYLYFFAELQLYPKSLKYSLITSTHPTLSADQSNHANIAHVILTHLLKDAVEGSERNQLSSIITFIFRFHQLEFSTTGIIYYEYIMTTFICFK